MKGTLVAVATLAIQITAAHAQLPGHVGTQYWNPPPGRTLDRMPPAPPSRYEAVPPPRPGYRWEPGRQVWRGDRYAWVPGRWIAVGGGYYDDRRAQRDAYEQGRRDEARRQQRRRAMDADRGDELGDINVR